MNELLLALHKVCNARVETMIVKIFLDSLAYTEIKCVKIYAILTIIWYSVVFNANFTRNIHDLWYACHMMDHYSIQPLWEQGW